MNLRTFCLTTIATASTLPNSDGHSDGQAVILAAQLTNDAELAAWVPNWDKDGKLTELVPGLGELKLVKHPIAHGTYAASFAVEDRPDLMVTYATDCLNNLKSTGVHRLFREFHIQANASSLGIAPKVHYISPPAPLPPFAGFARGPAKLYIYLRYKEDAWKECTATGSGDVRFVVHERLSSIKKDDAEVSVTLMLPGQSISIRMGEFFPLESVVGIGIAAMEKIKILHQAGIVHGDVTAASLGLLKNSSTDGLSSLKLMKFANSGFANSTVFPHKQQLDRPWQASPWEIKGEMPSMRSDIFRIVFVMARLARAFIHPVWANFKDVDPDVSQGYLFTLNGSLDPVLLVRNLSDSDRTTLRQILVDLTDYVRQLPLEFDPSAAGAPYSAVMSFLHQAQAIIKKSAGGETQQV